MLKLLRDNRASYSSTAVIGIKIITIFVIIGVLLVDLFLFVLTRTVIKTQLDYANRAVYSELDMNRLARRELYIDPVQGEAKFYEVLRSNLDLNASLEQINYRYRLVDVRVVDFVIYNEEDLPAVTPGGQSIDFVSVYSRLEVDIQPLLFGFQPIITIRPYLITDLPDHLVKTFRP